MKKTLTAALLSSAALCLPAVAQATPAEDAVVAQMEAAGYPHFPPSSVVANAHHICELIGKGTSKPDAAMQAVDGLGIGMAEATTLVDVSVANLCKA